MQSDNFYNYLQLTFADICNLNQRPIKQEIKPAHFPIVLEVEPAPLPKGTPENTPPTAYRYTLAFPGSGYMKLVIKVPESTPTITAAQIEEHSPLQVKVDGFTWGNYETGSGYKAYFKATKITPVRDTTSANTKS